MKVLITGHAGFIGTRLCKLLMSKGVDFVGYDLVNSDDIRDRIKLDKLFEAENFDVVVHMAALAGVRRSKEFPLEYESTNIIGTLNVVEMCKKYNCKMIFFSSSSVLGGNYSDKGLVEDDVYNPKSFYAITKMAGEFIVKNNLSNYIIIRPFTVYGENGRPDMVIYKWINQIKSGKPVTFFGDGTTKRGYTYVGDLVQGVYNFINILNIDSKHGVPVFVQNTVHLGGSEVISLEELREQFELVCYKKKLTANFIRMPMPKEDVESSFADTSKAFILIEFAPEKRFKKMVNKILNQEL
jgi:UDP-glucuronate 4-epimerase